MGYTSERTTINKSLESLNQETQRLQKQTNYEFDRLNQRRRDNIAANATWLSNNEMKLEMGLESFNELMTANEPEGGYDESMYETMSELRDQFYKTLQNRDAAGNDINPKDAQIERDQLMKEVVRASEDRGTNAVLSEKISAASAIQEGKPGSINGTTDPNTLGLFLPGTKKIPKVVDGRIVYDIFNPIIDEETGQPKVGDDGNYEYDMENPNQTRKSGELTRGVKDGSIGIVTEGDSTVSRNALQQERYDRYAEDLTKLIDKTNLNDQTISQDATEMMQRFEKDIATMDISDIINDNVGMRKNWTNVVDKVTNLAVSTDLYPEGENPFQNMLMEAAPELDKDGNGIIDKGEMTPSAMNSVLGAWNPNDPKIKKLAEDYYHTYDPTSGILPTYINDKFTQQRLLGADQLTANERRLQDKQNKTNKGGGSGGSDGSGGSGGSGGKEDKKTNPPKTTTPKRELPEETKVTIGEEEVTFNLKEPVETADGTYTFKATGRDGLIAVNGPDGPELINAGDYSDEQMEGFKKSLEAKNKGKTFKISGADRLQEITNKKKSNVDEKEETKIVDEKENSDNVASENEKIEDTNEIVEDTNEIVEEGDGAVEEKLEVELNGTSIVPKEKTGVNAEIAKVLNWENDNGYGNYGFTGGNQGANNPIRKSFDNFKASLKENNPDLNDQQLSALAAQESMNQNIIGGVEKGEGNTYTGKTILDNLNEGSTTFTREQFDNLPGPIQHALIDYKTNATSRNVKDMLMIVSGAWDGANARKNYSDLSQDEKDAYDNFDPAEFLKGWDWAKDLDPNNPQQKIMLEDMERKFEVARRDLYLDNGNSPDGAKGQWSKQKDRIKTATRKIEKDDPIVTIGLTGEDDKPHTVEEHFEYFKNSMTPANFFITNKLLPGDEITQYDGTIYTVPNY